MQEPHREGVAFHPDPESCVVARKGAIEALTGAQAGRVLSCEIFATGVPTLFSKAEGHIHARAIASVRETPRSLRPLAGLETPCAGTGRPHRCPSPHRWRTGRKTP